MRTVIVETRVRGVQLFHMLQNWRVPVIRLDRLILLLILVSSSILLEAQTGVFTMERDRDPMIGLDGLWRFHPGDDANWARPGFDDSGWILIRAVAGWKDQGFANLSGVAWYRIGATVPDDAPLSLFIPYCYTNYQVYADGKLVGGRGTMPPHASNYMSTPLLFDLPQSTRKGPHTITIALRVWLDPGMSPYVSGGLDGDARIGRSAEMHRYVAMFEQARAWRSAGILAVSGLEVLIGLASVALYLLRPKEKEYLCFGLAMVLYASIGLIDVHVRFHVLSYLLHDSIEQIAGGLYEVAWIGFYFYLLRASRNWLFWIAICSPAVFLAFLFADAHLITLSAATWNAIALLHAIPMFCWIVFLLIKRSREGMIDARLLLAPVILQESAAAFAGVANVMLQAGWIQQTPDWIDTTFNWPFPLPITVLGDALFVMAILGVLVLRFTRTRQQEERLSNELEAARTVQQVLIPSEVPAVSGLAIESVYMPASQVGEDFFQVIPVKAGGVLIVIGDVSGKGMPAAMTVSLLVGTIRTLAHFIQDPGAILSAMNQRMLARSKDGFTTCMVLRVSQEGQVTVANAGHIPLYIAGKEFTVDIYFSNFSFIVGTKKQGQNPKILPLNRFGFLLCV